MTNNSTHQEPGPETISRGVLTRGSAVLVCKNLKKGYLYLPGGHVENGETAATAVIREFEEETGLKVSPGRCVAVAEVLFGKGGHEINFLFHVEHVGELPDAVVSKEDGIGFEWIEAAAIVDADLRPRAIKAWLVGGGLTGDPDQELAEFITDKEDS